MRVLPIGARAALVPLAALAALATDVAAGEKVRLAFDPPAELRLEKKFEMHHALVVQQNEIYRGDEALVQMDNLEMESGLLVRHLDVFNEVQDGRPMSFRRRYDDVRLEAIAALPSPTGTSTDTLYASCPLTGKSVVFTYRPEDEEYARYYDVEEAPEELLPRLTVDTDVACLLPDHEVETGEEWTVQAADTRALFGYGGDLDLRFAREMNDILLARNLLFGVGGSLWYAFEEPPQGTIKATLREVREEEGVRVAVIGLVVDFTCKVDQTALANEKRNAIELTAKLVVKDAQLEVDLEGDGELLWDLDHNAPYGMRIVCAESVYTSRRWKDRERGVPSLLPTMPSQDVKLLGALRIDLTTTRSLPGEGTEQGPGPK